MVAVSGVGIGVSNPHNQKQQPASRLKIGRIFDGFRKFAFDSIVNLSSKATKGREQLHKTVHEEFMRKTALKPCNDKEKPGTKSSVEEEIHAKMENTQEEMNTVKHITAASSETQPVSSDKSPPEQPKENQSLMPNKKRVFIRSRL